MRPDAYLVEASMSVPAGEAPPNAQLQLDTGGLRVWTSRAQTALPVQRFGSVVLVGELFTAGVEDPQRRFELLPVAHWSFGALCRRIQARAWGRYVLFAWRSGRLDIFRDPAGALDAVCWRRDERIYVANGACAAWRAQLPRQLSIDWDAAAAQLTDAAAAAGQIALRGLYPVAPGARACFSDAGRLESQPLWSPAGAARRELPPDLTPEAHLRRQVHDAVAAFAAAGQPVLAEISGGLDSAIVAAALKRAGAEVAGWVNYLTDNPEGDERPFARAVAAHLDLPLIERRKPPLRYTEASLSPLGREVRPALAGLDPQYEASTLGLAAECGAQVLVTGQGGDAVFFQMASPLTLADRLRRERRLDATETLAYARRLRRPVWGVLASALSAALFAPSPPSPPAPAFVTSAARRIRHPWLEDLAGVPPAKRVQIRALAAAQLRWGASPRAEHLRCLNPLLSQPVIEAALAIPCYRLAEARKDRALARRAFAEELPPTLRSRRSKGSLQAFYGRAVAASLDVLRPWLLDGRLAEVGLIRREALEPLLDADVLIARPEAVQLLRIAALESWARTWSRSG